MGGSCGTAALLKPGMASMDDDGWRVGDTLEELEQALRGAPSLSAQQRKKVYDSLTRLLSEEPQAHQAARPSRALLLQLASQTGLLPLILLDAGPCNSQPTGSRGASEAHREL